MEITRGLYHSEGVLLALVDSGLTREEAYRLVTEKGKPFRDAYRQIAAKYAK